MTDIVLVEKTGELKSSKYVAGKDELYKKCKFKKDENFELRHTWTTKKEKYSFKSVSLYARDSGKANTEISMIFRHRLTAFCISDVLL